MRSFLESWRRVIITVLLAMVAMWGVLRAERVFNQAWNDYRDFQAMRIWIIQHQQAAPPVPK